ERSEHGTSAFEPDSERGRPRGSDRRVRLCENNGGNRKLASRRVDNQSEHREDDQCKGDSMAMKDSIQMSVGGLTLDPVTKTPIVILKDMDNKMNLPIWIGLLEATAMATELEGIKMARTMTHDMRRNILIETAGANE